MGENEEERRRGRGERGLRESALCVDEAAVAAERGREREGGREEGGCAGQSGGVGSSGHGCVGRDEAEEGKVIFLLFIF